MRLVLIACLALAGCASSTLATVDMVLKGAGMTRKAYCLLTEEERADFRQRRNLPHVIRCAGDPPSVAEREGNWDAEWGREAKL